MADATKTEEKAEEKVIDQAPEPEVKAKPAADPFSDDDVAADETTDYVLTPGENAYTLARNHYHDDSRVKELLRLNPGAGWYVGEHIKLPPIEHTFSRYVREVAIERHAHKVLSQGYLPGEEPSGVGDSESDLSKAIAAEARKRHREHLSRAGAAGK